MSLCLKHPNKIIPPQQGNSRETHFDQRGSSGGCQLGCDSGGRVRQEGSQGNLTYLETK